MARLYDGNIHFRHKNRDIIVCADSGVLNLLKYQLIVDNQLNATNLFYVTTFISVKP